MGNTWSFHGNIDNFQKKFIDEILILVMKSQIALQEDIVELHCHGGVVVNKVLETYHHIILKLELQIQENLAKEHF